MTETRYDMMTQSRLKILRDFNPEAINEDYRERRIIIGGLNVQYWRTFKKSKLERLQLKCAKAQAKLELLHT